MSGAKRWVDVPGKDMHRDDAGSRGVKAVTARMKTPELAQLWLHLMTVPQACLKARACFCFSTRLPMESIVSCAPGCEFSYFLSLFPLLSIWFSDCVFKNEYVVLLHLRYLQGHEFFFCSFVVVVVVVVVSGLLKALNGLIFWLKNSCVQKWDKGISSLPKINK